MTTIRILIVLVAGGILLLAFADEYMPLIRRRVRGARAKYSGYLTWHVLVQPAIFVILGLVMRDLILSVFLFALAGVVAWYRIREARESQGRVTVRQILLFVSIFRGEYFVQPAVIYALEASIKRIEPPIRDMARAAVEAFYATSSSERAFSEFRKRTDNVLLHQFAYILEMGEETSKETMLEVLDAYLGRLRAHEDLERQVETGLANVLSETRFMQSTIYVILFAVALIAYLRNAWVDSLGWRLIYMVMLTLAMAVSYYVERELRLLKERIQ